MDRSAELASASAVVMPSTEWPPGDSDLADVRETARAISRELGAPYWRPRR